MATYSYLQTFTQTNSIVFMSDNLRNTLRDVIREYGLSPNKLMQEWVTIERGIQTWLRLGQLRRVVVEFFRPGASVASARWDFPVSYTGSGVADDMWADKSYLRQLIAKSARPPSDCTYRVVLCSAPGAANVDGFSDCGFLSTGQLAARQAGTVIATGYMTAGATYWR